MPVGIEAWVNQIPPVTRTWLVLSVLTSLAVVRATRQISHLTVILILGHGAVAISVGDAFATIL